MTKFEYVRPKKFVELHEKLDKIKAETNRDIGDIAINGSDEERGICLELLDESTEEYNQRLKWLLDNKDEIGFVSCQTEDLGPVWEDMARWYDNNGQEVFSDGISYINVATGPAGGSLESYKEYLRRIGFDQEWLDDFIHDNGILK